MHVLVCVLVCKKIFVYAKCQQQVDQNSGVCSGGNWSKKCHLHYVLILHCCCVKH